MKSREISRSKIGPFSSACTDPYIGIGWEYQSTRRSNVTLSQKAWLSEQLNAAYIFLRTECSIRLLFRFNSRKNCQQRFFSGWSLRGAQDVILDSFISWSKRLRYCASPIIKIIRLRLFSKNRRATSGTTLNEADPKFHILFTWTIVSSFFVIPFSS